jgi:hypothetical protein
MPMAWVFAAWMERSSHQSLTRLLGEVGVAGMAAASALPGLSAVVDQHAAAVRDILTAGVEGSTSVAGVVLLASYARGLLEQARAQGWRLVMPSGEGWAAADWITVRLVAVWSLARSA